MKEKLNFEVYKKNSGNYKEYLTNLGFDLWTEYNAYALSFKKFPHQKGPTFLRLVYIYKELKSFYNKKLLSSKQIKDENIAEFTRKLSNFVYTTALYLSFFHFGKESDYRYCKKTYKTEEFKFILKFLNKIVNKLRKIVGKKYKKSMLKNLHNIEKIIFEEIYWQFDFALEVKNNIVKLVWYEYSD